MNESIISYHARQHKLISDSLGLPSLDDKNESHYPDEDLRTFRVPVTLIKRGSVTINASCKKSAEDVVRVVAGLSDDLDSSISSEVIGSAFET